MSQVFILHDSRGYWCKTRKLTLNERNSTCIELHKTIFDCFEITAKSSYRCADFMRKVGKKIWSYTFLNRERFVEIINRGNEGRKLIAICVWDVCIFGSIDIFLESFCNKFNRRENSLYPNKVKSKDKNKPNNICHEHLREKLKKKSSFRRITRYKTWVDNCIEYIWKTGWNSSWFYFWNIKYFRILECSRTCYIQLWMTWNIFYWSWKIWNFCKNFCILLLLFIIECSYTGKNLYLLGTRSGCTDRFKFFLVIR